MLASLSDLAAEEERLMLEVGRVSGTIEEKQAALRDLGVFDAYRTVHAAYAAGAPSDGEALKRALFVQWYAAVEPAAFTGIADVDDSAAARVLAEVERHVRAGTLDPELAAFVALYRSIADWYFDASRTPELCRLLPTLSADAWGELDPASLRGRGQMSAYLLSMLASRSAGGFSRRHGGRAVEPAAVGRRRA